MPGARSIATKTLGMGTRNLPQSHGFTVIELLVALAILAIFAGAAALAWPRLEAALRLDAATHQLAADLHDARVLAIASAARVRLVFTPGAARYRLERADDAGTFALAAMRVLPRGIAIADANSGGDLVFSARGNAENGTIVLVDRRGLHASVRLNQRGRVTIDRGRT
jgi:prepilin-type N-terminal cleavage/methylation domain-containing protein